MNVPTTAMVLAAGLGTRMRPLTNDRSKALVEVAGKALVDHMLDRLADVGVETAVVNVHYFADRLEQHLAGRTRPRIVISDERERLLETGGGLKKARPLVGEEPIWIANIDSVWTEDGPSALEAMARAWDPEKMDVLLLCVPLERSFGFDGAGDFFCDEAGRLSFRGEADRAPLAYIGVHICKPNIIDGCEDEAFSLTPIWRRLADEGRLHGVLLEGDWMHVGDPEALKAAEARLR